MEMKQHFSASVSQPQMQWLQTLPALARKHLQSLSSSCFTISTHAASLLPSLLPGFRCVVSTVTFPPASSLFQILCLTPQLNLLQKQPHVEKFPLPHSFATLCCTKENVVLIPRVLNYISFTLIISFGALAQASGDKEEAEWHIPSFTQNYPPI